MAVSVALIGSMADYAGPCWRSCLPAVAAEWSALPAFLYTYVVVIWHWKDRYRGKHSDLWGAVILLETSGWLKLVYLFRHLIPDMRHSGRYADSSPLEQPFPMSTPNPARQE